MLSIQASIHQAHFKEGLNIEGEGTVTDVACKRTRVSWSKGVHPDRRTAGHKLRRTN